MFKSSSTFDKLLDKATSLSNLEPDWAGILQICDAIRQNDVQPKFAVSAIKKKLYVTNPNVVLMTLQVLESCIKNCGAVFHIEVATKTFMDDIHDLYKQSTDTNVREAILKLIQGMAHAFRNEPSYRAVQDKMKVMKAEGLTFPVLKESDAMFSASTAPEWADGECCHRCRVQFTMVVRKHHCRNCGQVFCAKCSSRNSTIPKFGIEKEVRVCDVCYEKINKKSDNKPSLEEPKAKASTSTAPTQAPNKKSEQEIQEEEELQLALALSKSEAESKERERMRYSQYSTPKVNSSASTSTNSKHKKSSKSKVSKTAKKVTKSENSNGENEDPELARYLNREYWEQRTNAYAEYEPSPSPSAPQPSLTSSTKTSNMETIEPKVFKDKLATAPNENDELESFANALRSTIEIFVNRLNSNKLRGRPITNDNGVQSLFMNLTNMHSQLIMYTQQINEARTNCERLQDKISQIRDARAALDALREEHLEQMRRAAEEAERIRQQQMAQKLEIMRKKKQEYLQYQREMALQRMQEQELMMRNEQFKQFNPSVIPSAQNVALPQWNNGPSVPATGYYLPNQNYPNTLPNPVALGNPSHNQQQQPTVVGQYVQATLPTNPNMVASHQPPMANSVPQMAVPVQGPIPQVMPQFVGPMTSMPAPNMYMPGVAPNYPPEVQQNAQPPTQYQMAPPVANSQQQAPEAKEELLINFD